MDPGAVIALVSVIATVILVVVGGIIKYLLGQLSKANTKVELAEQTITSRQEVIEELRRQVQGLEITARMQDKIFSALPHPPGQWQPPASTGNQ